jgi:predicted peptidase
MKTATIPSSLGGNQLLSIFEPATLNDGKKHPLLLEFQGSGQYGNTSFDPNSVSGQLNAGKSLPSVYADAIVINVHQPNNGNLVMQPGRLKDARIWALATYPMVDSARVAICGLSLGGGGVFAATQDTAFAKLLCAAIPCAGTQDFDKALLFQNIIVAQLPTLIYGSNVDDNPPTKSVFQMMQWLPGYKAAQEYCTIIDTNTGHGGVWSTAYGPNGMWSWLAQQTRAGVVAPPVQPPVVATKKLIATVKIPGTPAVYVPALSIPIQPDRTVNTYQMPDGTFASEVV